MSELVEKVARAIYDYQMSGMDCRWENEGNKDTWTEWARAALAAIEVSGTHVVVPTRATDDMIRASVFGRFNKRDHADIYQTMLSVRPRVVDLQAEAEKFIEANTVPSPPQGDAP